MKIRARHILIGAVIFNSGMLLLTGFMSWQAEEQNPIKGSIVDVGNMRIHVVESPEGIGSNSDEPLFDRLVLIHGASTSSLDFSDNLLPELSKLHPTVAIDRPGHGYSDRGQSDDMDNPTQQAKIILNTLAELQIERPVIIGHSWGGALVMAALLEINHIVKPAAGILISGVTHPYEREDSTPTKLALSPIIGPIFRWQYLAPIGRMAVAPTVESFFKPDDVPANYVEDTGLYLSLRPRTYLYNALDRSRLSNHLVSQSKLYQSVKLPLLSIASSADSVVPPSDHHVKIIDSVPGSVSIVIEGAGHSPHHTRTDEVVTAIGSFLGSLE